MLQVAEQMVNTTACDSHGAVSQKCAGVMQDAATHDNQMLLASFQLLLWTVITVLPLFVSHRRPPR